MNSPCFLLAILPLWPTAFPSLLWKHIMTSKRVNIYRHKNIGLHSKRSLHGPLRTSVYKLHRSQTFCGHYSVITDFGMWMVNNIRKLLVFHSICQFRSQKCSHPTQVLHSFESSFFFFGHLYAFPSSMINRSQTLDRFARSSSGCDIFPKMLKKGQICQWLSKISLWSPLHSFKLKYVFHFCKKDVEWTWWRLVDIFKDYVVRIRTHDKAEFRRLSSVHCIPQRTGVRCWPLSSCSPQTVGS